VYVVPSVYDAFVEKAVAAARRLKLGYSLEPRANYHLGPVVAERQMEVVERHVADALERGARLLTGGRRDGLYYEPTVLVDVTHDMRVMQEETFGPIMPIMKVRDEAEAVRQANDSVFGLSASVWSRNHERGERVARQLQVGSVLINDTISHFGVPSLPFGGMKQSGFGRSHGKAGLLQFTQPHAHGIGDPPHPLDLATILRRPGNYELGSTLMQLAFGTSPRQRAQPLIELAERQAHRVGPARLGLGMAAVATAAAVAAAFGARRRSSGRGGS
jgi:delta 1-pyrroline-5-carboxylate dehydrogenase